MFLRPFQLSKLVLVLLTVFSLEADAPGLSVHAASAATRAMLPAMVRLHTQIRPESGRTWDVFSPSTVPAAVQSGPVEKKHKSLDSCLFGIWYVADYESFMSSLSPNLEIKGITGVQAIKYKKDGDAITVANHFTVSAVAKDTQLSWTVELTGQASANWKTPSKGTVKYSAIDGAFKETITIDGKSGTSNAEGLFGATAQHYACGKKYLDIWPSRTHPPIIMSRTHP